MKFLYGASVQGIQKFIFETNKLQEIAGASEIIELICTKMYEDFIDKNEVEVLIAAAGNIKLIGEKDEFKKIVREFPKAVQEFAPGISISQAVVDCNSDNAINLLEKRLKIQRNKPNRPNDITAIAIERSRRTGKPAVGRKEKKLCDASTLKKCAVKNDGEDKNAKDATYSLEEKLDADNPNKFPKNFSSITSKKCGWLAVIHADGNSLGKIVKELGTNNIKKFSDNLNEATITAAKNAFNDTIKPKSKGNYPFRPIIIGGDDLTVICRADLALPFIKKYLEEFETQTEKEIKTKLTACAGITFVKNKYPFHYAIHLAEELCGVAKKKSKGINEDNVPASIAFHKIQSSFVDSYKEIKERELFAKSSDVRFDFGPYGLDDKINDLPNINELLEKVKIINEDEAPKSGIRKWLTELHNNKGTADQLMDRIIQITDSKYSKKLELEKNKKGSKTILYDVLTIASLKGGK